jgi:hypothetical protein
LNNLPKKEILTSQANARVITRMEALLQIYAATIEKEYQKIHINVKVVRHLVESYFQDLDRMKTFHEINRADRHKCAAFTMIWITRTHPIQLESDVNMTIGHMLINELFAVHAGLNRMELKIADISAKYLKNLLYTLHFRIKPPEIMASSMYLLECACNGQKP